MKTETRGTTSRPRRTRGTKPEQPIGEQAEQQALEIQERNQALLALLDKWLADESGYDEETWPELKKALEENRMGARRLFRE